MSETLAVFVKAPEAGQVKTRLASAIGAIRAARLYRRIGRHVVEQCLAPDVHRTAVWFTPANAELKVRSWLQHLPVHAFHSQVEAGLGERLGVSLQHHFAEGAQRIVITGSDCPTVTRALVRRAFLALTSADLVIGPARDGGFYLIGLTEPRPALFWHVEWSTDRVLNRTLLNATQLALKVEILPELRDVDTAADARALGLIGELPISGPWIPWCSDTLLPGSVDAEA